jgi:hypothetical protein
MSARRPRLLALWMCLAALGFVPRGQAQSGVPQNPAPVSAFEVEGGYKFSFLDGEEDDSFYRFSYNGSLVRSSGTPFQFAEGLDLTEPSGEPGGDRNTLNLRFEQGTTTLDGELLEAGGVRALNLRGLEKLDLRGTAFVGADLENETVQFAVGLESKPLRIPGVTRSGASNWLVFGVNGQRQEQSDTNAGDENLGLLTYRAFLGKAFGWRKSADVNTIAVELARRVLDQAPNLAAARGLEAKVKAVAANQRRSEQQLFLDALGEEPTTDEEWVETVRSLALGEADAITDQPTFSAYAEATGWYEWEGSSEDKQKNLLLVTLDYWPLQQRDDFFLRVRYENGYERAVPNVKKDHVLLSVATRF